MTVWYRYYVSMLFLSLLASLVFSTGTSAVYDDNQHFCMCMHVSDPLSFTALHEHMGGGVAFSSWLCKLYM